MSTHYETLGISESAGIDEIKKAYRGLAKKYHPDQNQNNAEAENKFKEISNAYSILSDENKRKEYDNARLNPGVHSWSFGTNTGGIPPEFDDIINQIFRQHGFANIHRQHQRNRDVNLTMDITLEEAFNGKSTLIKYTTPSGLEKEIMANIPAGIESGVRVRFQGNGEQTNKSISAGDLYINVIVQDHPIFKREGNNLHSIIHIDAISAILGTKYRMKCIDDKLIDVVIPPGTQAGSFFRVDGEGMKIRSGNYRGDLILHVKILIPVDLDEKIRNNLIDIQKSRGIDDKGIY